MRLDRLLSSLALFAVLVGAAWGDQVFQPAETGRGSVTRYVLTEPPGAAVISAEAYTAWAQYDQAYRQYQQAVKQGQHPTPPHVPGKSREPIGHTSDSGPVELTSNLAQAYLILPGHQPFPLDLDDYGSPDRQKLVILLPDNAKTWVWDHLRYDLTTHLVLVLLLLGVPALLWYHEKYRIVVLSDASQPSFIDRVIDGYQVTQKLGEGAFSQVYKAVKVGTDETVAMKVLKREYLQGQDTDVLNRFYRETMVQLVHPNVVTVLDCGEHMLRPYIILEYIDGTTLRGLMQPKLPPAQALHIFVEMGKGLAFAHQRGYVHRDLKPENVMVTLAGRVKIMDFGIAKHLNKPGATRSATTMGTPRYMSPEHLDSKRTDARADVYSMGVILFEMLTGQAPFEGELMELISAHLFTPPPRLTDVDPDLPVELADVVARLLVKSPDERYQTMEDAVEGVQAAASTLHLDITAPSP